jgi:UDP-N-acetylmuramate dehydrogenase
MIAHPAVRDDVELAPFTTYKVGGPARWFAEPRDLAELREILSMVPDGVPVVVLGRGSNVVISDAGIPGLVLRLGEAFAAIDVRPDGMVVAGGATPLPVLARTTATAGRSGLEFYVGIPGSVGGAVRMNAGGHGSETSSVLVEASVLDIPTRSVTRRSPHDLDMSYRHSNLTDDDIVVQAAFRTVQGDPAEAERVVREITRWRKDNQPGGTLNAGSVFKNPAREPAGAIIDRLGLKGTSIGPVGVSPVHANFMVATKDATASDIFTFVHHVRAIVRERAGIDLEPEIRFIGAFPIVGVDA